MQASSCLVQPDDIYLNLTRVPLLQREEEEDDNLWKVTRLYNKTGIDSPVALTGLGLDLLREIPISR